MTKAGRSCGLVVAWLVLAMVLLGSAAAAQEPLIADASNSPNYRVEITTGFVGTDVVYFGAKEGPGDVIVVIRGPILDYSVRRKQRVAGIWINTDKVSFGDVPSFYAVASSRPLDELLPRSLRVQQGIGLDALDLPTVKSEREGDIDSFRSALLRLKEQSGQFAREVGKVKILGDRLFSTTVHFPANVPTGSYFVTVMLVRDKDIVSAQQVHLEVGKIGADAGIYEYAHIQSALYGLTAIAGALLAGWAAHLVFRMI